LEDVSSKGINARGQFEELITLNLIFFFTFSSDSEYSLLDVLKVVFAKLK
jgi:hypothetical protein